MIKNSVYLTPLDYKTTNKGAHNTPVVRYVGYLFGPHASIYAEKINLSKAYELKENIYMVSRNKWKEAKRLGIPVATLSDETTKEQPNE